MHFLPGCIPHLKRGLFGHCQFNFGLVYPPPPPLSPTPPPPAPQQRLRAARTITAAPRPPRLHTKFRRFSALVHVPDKLTVVPDKLTVHLLLKSRLLKTILYRPPPPRTLSAALPTYLEICKTSESINCHFFPYRLFPPPPLALRWRGTEYFELG